MDFRQHAQGKRILLCENDERVLEAAKRLAEEGVVTPVLVGITHEGIESIAIEPEKYAEQYYALRKHKGITPADAKKTLEDPAFYSAMLLLDGQADGLVCGASWPTTNTLRPALQLLREGLVASYFIMDTPKGEYVFGDCALNVNPTAEELAEIALSLAQAAEDLGMEPRVALLSHSTEGSASNDDQQKVMHAATLAKEKAKDGWTIGGELQVDAAMDEAVSLHKAPHSPLRGDANVLVFPDLDAGNIGYKLVQRFTGCEAIGPLLTNLKKPVNDLSRGCTADEIVAVAYVTAWQASR